MYFTFSIAFLKFEILILLLSVSYILYYLGTRFYELTHFIYSLIKPVEVASRISVIDEERENNISEKEIQKQKNEDADTYSLSVLLKQIQLNKVRGEYDLAKNNIIEALLIDKFNKAINLELAWIYLIEWTLEKAEIIYKDLLLIHNDDFELLKNLGYVLSLQNKFWLAIEIYKKAHSLNSKDLEVINALAQLNFYQENFQDSIFFFRKYLKSFPRDTQNLTDLGIAYEKVWDYKQALLIYQKILEFEPYNNEIIARIERLETPS